MLLFTVIVLIGTGQYLVVGQSGLSASFISEPRINHKSIKNPDVVFNSIIVVHSLFFRSCIVKSSNQSIDDELFCNGVSCVMLYAS